MKLWFKQYASILTASCFVLTTIIWFAPTLFQGKVPLPTDLVYDYLLNDVKQGDNPLIRDSVVQLYPNIHVMFTAVQAGDWSGWNPYIFSGLDMGASGQSTLWSPLTIFIPLFDSSLNYLTFIIIFYFLLSGLTMYSLLIGLGYRKEVALFGGIAFQLSGPLVGWLAWGTISGVIIWVPLMLLAVHKAVPERKPFWLVVLSFANYASLTAGHLQFYLYGLMLVTAYTIHNVIKNRYQLQRYHWLWLVITGVVNAVLIFLITRPFIQALAISHRGTITDTSHLGFKNLVQFIQPNIWGNWQSYAGPLNYLESLGYIGILPIVCIALGLLLLKKMQWQQLWFWLGVAALSLVYMLVDLPTGLFSSFPPFRALFVLDIALIIIAVHLLERQLVLWPKAGTKVAIVIAAVAFFDQYGALGQFTPQQDPEPLHTPPAYVQFLQSAGSEPLVYSELSPVNVYSLYGIRSIFGYDSSYPEWYYQHIKQHGEIISHRNILNAKITNRTFLRELGVDYIITKRELKHIDPVYEKDGIRIYDIRVD